MAQDINTVALTGRLTKDAEYRAFQNGGVFSISMAVNRSQKGQDGQWHDVASFLDVKYFAKSPNLQQYLKKGTQVGVQGSVEQETWEKDGQKRSRVVIRAVNLQLLGSRQNGGQQGGFQQRQQNYQQPNMAQQAYGQDNMGFPEDVPF